MWAISLILTLFLTTPSIPIEEAPVHEITVVDFKGFEEYVKRKSHKVLVVNFWATWCVPCVKELPYFEEAYDHYAGTNVEILLVSLDFEHQIESRLIPFIEKKGLRPQVIVLDDPDANAWIDKVDPSWSGAIPATFVKHGNDMEFYEQSFHSVDELKEIIQPFLKS